VYDEKMLEIVAQSMDVFERQTPAATPQTPRRGHFECDGCDSPPMSPNRHYVTALVVDFERNNEVMFPFIYCTNDIAYREATLRHLQHMGAPRNGNWVYLTSDLLEDTFPIHIRGYWELDGTFIHKTQVIDLSERIEIDTIMFDGEEHPAEFGISLWKTGIVGSYYDNAELSRYSRWTPAEKLENTIIASQADHMFPLQAERWKKRKVKVKAKRWPKYARTTITDEFVQEVINRETYTT